MKNRKQIIKDLKDKMKMPRGDNRHQSKGSLSKR